MRMYKGESKQGIDFYNLLLESDDFTSELGKVTLASGMLETEIIMYFKRKGIKVDSKHATLGRLIKIGEKENAFDKNMLIALNVSIKQRNKFIHNLYSLFVELIDEELLPRKNLLDSDVDTYKDYAWQLRENIEGLAEIISKK